MRGVKGSECVEGGQEKWEKINGKGENKRKRDVRCVAAGA